MQEIYGVCCHPVYGGFVSLDGVLIFWDVLCPDLLKRDPEDVIRSQEKRLELLEKYNRSDWSYRDLLSETRQYADEHKKYLLSSNLNEKIATAKQIKSRCSDVQ